MDNSTLKINLKFILLGDTVVVYHITMWKDADIELQLPLCCINI